MSRNGLDPLMLKPLMICSISILDTSQLSERENYNLIRNLTSETHNFYKFFIRGSIQFLVSSLNYLEF